MIAVDSRRGAVPVELEVHLRLIPTDPFAAHRTQFPDPSLTRPPVWTDGRQGRRSEWLRASTTRTRSFLTPSIGSSLRETEAAGCSGPRSPRPYAHVARSILRTRRISAHHGGRARHRQPTVVAADHHSASGESVAGRHRYTSPRRHSRHRETPVNICIPIHMPDTNGLRHEPPGRCIERALGSGQFRGGDALEPAHHAAAGGALLILSSEAQKISGGQLSESRASGSSSARMAGPTAGSTSPVCSPAEQNFGEHSSAESRSEARAPS